MGTLCASGAVVFKAGFNAATLAEADYDFAILQAESTICAETRYNWIDAYATLNADVKYILEQACSDLAAITNINYDPDAIGRTTAELKMDVLSTNAAKAIKTLTELKNRDFMTGA